MSSDAVLCRMFDEQAVIYSQALALAQALSTQPDEESRQADLQEIIARIDGMRGLETRHQSALKTWREQRQPASPELRVRMDAVSKLIQSLQTLLDSALQEAQARKAALTPQFDALSRLEQGRKAYGAAYSHVPPV